jgi:hypothetical protein
MKNLRENKIIIFILKYKWIVLILLLAFTVFVALQPKKTVNKTAQDIINTPSPTALPLKDASTSSNNEKAYFINQLTTSMGPVTGFSWDQNLLYYSNPNGIYKAGTNEAVLEMPIQKIYWSKNGNLIFKSNNVWSKSNLSKEAIPVNKDLNNPIINNSGSLILDASESQLKMYGIEDSSEKIFKTKEINERIVNYFFSDDSQKIFLSTEFGTKTIIYKLDTSLNEMSKKVFEGKYTLSSISPDGEIFLLSQEGLLIVANFTETRNTFNLLQKSKIFSSFRNLNEIIIVEQYKDNLGRTLENIYKTNPTGNIIRISDSRPIKNRINTSVPMAFNGDKNIATFAENKGGVWILSLSPNLFPTYSTEGELIYSNISPYSH